MKIDVIKKDKNTTYCIVENIYAFIIIDYEKGSYFLPRYNITLYCDHLNPEIRYYDCDDFDIFFNSTLKMTQSFWSNGKLYVDYAYINNCIDEIRTIQRDNKLTEFLK